MWVRCYFLDNYVSGERSPVPPGYHLKTSKECMECGQSLYKEKELDLPISKTFWTGDKTKWLFGAFNVYNQKTYGRNICVEQRCYQSLGPLWCSVVDSWILDTQTGHLSKIYVVIHTNDVLHINGFPIGCVIFLEQSLWKISYMYTFCLEVMLITYLCCINIFSSLQLLITILKEERPSWKKALQENRIHPISIRPVILFDSLRFRTCDVFNIAFEISGRMIHNWDLGYIVCM